MKETDFLRIIRDQPDDDVCRLAYADWLQERGDEISQLRGEFIQVQIELARRMQGKGKTAEWLDLNRVPELRAREQALLAAHGAEWAKPVAALVDSYTFHKGFPEQIQVTTSRFCANAEKLGQHTPIRRIRFTDGITKKVTACKALAGVAVLDFSGMGMGDSGLNTLLGSPHLGRLEELNLSYCSLTDAGVIELARSPLLGQLESLDLGYNLLRVDAVKALFASRYWGKVRQLVLRGNYQIDSRVNQLFTQRLQQNYDPALLRSMLHTQSRGQHEYTNADVRELAERAASQPARAAEILTEGLHDGNRKVRAAAAWMLAQLGETGTSAVPKLVQRLFEPTATVKDYVGPALARLVPELRPEMQRWLCVLANPLLPATVNLRDALAHPKLPAEAREEFAAVCARRGLWWKHVAHGGTGPAPLPESGSYPTDARALRQVTTELLEKAGQHAGKHHHDKRKDKAMATGMMKEAAWLLARLTEALQRNGSAPTAQSEPRTQRDPRFADAAE